MKILKDYKKALHLLLLFCWEIFKIPLSLIYNDGFLRLKPWKCLRVWCYSTQNLGQFEDIFVGHISGGEGVGEAAWIETLSQRNLFFTKKSCDVQYAWIQTLSQLPWREKRNLFCTHKKLCAICLSFQFFGHYIYSSPSESTSQQTLSRKTNINKSLQ